ncbi:glycine cleavage system H protein [Endobacter medicaginis]|jgi:glycine cleavage system H protein|uniref:Glycine cleavage system H protein n=1 Tax=Endobacter medicaginis TaxID=1181271 RepID=A0A850NJ56_9PROT|nr:glycine cleavage system protein GcvH [Endobacter medicaginis]MBB3174681.1 glycine cleavage system H protein [Endobacter medicaginis]MCX5474924.1 glycine cleavage system protein GcvH [Endobacter medicaginis]NVN28934.1 glycine cleavage system protein GcvH [Endobacter medicaginis]
MTETRYTESHEWVRRESDGSLTVGITDHAQQALGDVVFVETPDVGRELTAKETAAVVESVKAASDIYAPVAGTVIAANEALSEDPALVNSEAESGAWFFKLKPADPSEFEALMDADAYAAFAAEH